MLGRCIHFIPWMGCSYQSRLQAMTCVRWAETCMAPFTKPPGRQKAPKSLSRPCRRHVPAGACLLGSRRCVGPRTGAAPMMCHLLCSLHCRGCWSFFKTLFDQARIPPSVLMTSPPVTCHTAHIHKASLMLPSMPEVAGSHCSSALDRLGESV